MKIPLFLILSVLSLSLIFPAYSEIQTLDLGKPFYTNDELLQFVGIESNGSQAVSVVIRGPSGNFITLLGDPFSDSDGSFETISKKVNEIFTSSGIYNATGFTESQTESEGITLQLEYDGNKVILLPNYVLELNPISDKIIQEEKTLSFTASVTDSSLDDLIFSLQNGVPTGASIDSSSGKFVWTPTLTQGHPQGLDYTFDIVVQKGILEDRESIRITVTESEIQQESESQSESKPKTELHSSEEPLPIPAPFVDPTKDPQSYVNRYNNEANYKKWFDENYPEYSSIYQAVGLEEPLPIPAPFVDPTKDPQSYVNRYNNEANYKKWFDENYPEYSSIYQAVGLEEPLTVAPFVDPALGAQYYIDRYNTEPKYKEWFDSNFPEMTIYEAVGVEEPETIKPQIGECGIGTQLVDGKCEVISKEQGGGCLIATAAYGTELAPQVQFLREIRDNTLLSTSSGTSFMTAFNSVYYSFSPAVADLERESSLFREAVKLFITPMLSTLSIMTLADEGSESQVLGLGISVIALNLGMYVAAPAIIGFKLRGHLKSRK